MPEINRLQWHARALSIELKIQFTAEVFSRLYPLCTLYFTYTYLKIPPNSPVAKKRNGRILVP